MEMEGDFLEHLEKQYLQELQALKDKYARLIEEHLNPKEEEEPKYLTRRQKRLKEQKETPPYVDLDEDIELHDDDEEEREEVDLSPFPYPFDSPRSFYHDDEEAGDDCGDPEADDADARSLSLFVAAIPTADAYIQTSGRDAWYMQNFGARLNVVKNNLGNDNGTNQIAKECWENIIYSCFHGRRMREKSQHPNSTKCGFCGMKRMCAVTIDVEKQRYEMGQYCFALAKAVEHYYTKLFSLRNTARATVDDAEELMILLDEIEERQEDKNKNSKKANC